MNSNNQTAPYVAKHIANSLDKAKDKIVNGNQDRLYIIDGREGLGKSTLAMQLAYYFDPTFGIDDIVFNSKSFEKRIRECEKFKAIVFDEAFNGLSSKGSLSTENKNLIRLLMECRQRNLFIFIVLPTYFMLEKYVAIFRSNALLSVRVSKKNYKLRYYKAYNYHQKKLLYIKGKQMMDYSKPYIMKNHSFYGRYPPTIDKKEYDKKKHEAFLDENDEKKSVDTKQTIQRNILVQFMKDRGITFIDMAQCLEQYNIKVDDGTIGRWAKKIPEIALRKEHLYNNNTGNGSPEKNNNKEIKEEQPTTPSSNQESYQNEPYQKSNHVNFADQKIRPATTPRIPYPQTQIN